MLTLFLDPLSDSGGLHFPKAIFQLMIGLYCLEGCMVGLFLTSGITSNSLNMWLAAIMIISVVSTGIFHYRLQSVFVPIVKYLPMALYNTGRDTTSKVESSIRSSGLTSNSRKPSSRKTSIRSASEFYMRQVLGLFRRNTARTLTVHQLRMPLLLWIRVKLAAI